MNVKDFVRLVRLPTITQVQIERHRKAARIATVYREELIEKLRNWEEMYALQAKARRARMLLRATGCQPINRKYYRHKSFTYTLEEICVALQLHRIL